MSQENKKPSSRMRRFRGLPKQVSELVENESDRGAILILSAYVEEMIGLIVSEACTSEKLGEELLEFRKPAGDFSSKILLCEAFGLISPDEARAANCLRRIRNSAAHFDQKGRGFAVLFDSAQTAQQIKTFCECLNLGLNAEAPEGVRAGFVVATRLLTTKLSLRVFEVRRSIVPPTMKETANEWRSKMKDTEMGKLVSEAEEEAEQGKPEKLFDLMKKTSEVLKQVTGQVLEEMEARDEVLAEQDGADQPATALEAKPKGIKEPKSESEARSQ